jgi:hypothetical protein
MGLQLHILSKNKNLNIEHVFLSKVKFKYLKKVVFVLPVLPVALADCSVDVASAAGADLRDFQTSFYYNEA